MIVNLWFRYMRETNNPTRISASPQTNVRNIYEALLVVELKKLYQMDVFIQDTDVHLDTGKVIPWTESVEDWLNG